MAIVLIIAIIIIASLVNEYIGYGFSLWETFIHLIFIGVAWLITMEKIFSSINLTFKDAIIVGILLVLMYLFSLNKLSQITGKIDLKRISILTFIRNLSISLMISVPMIGFFAFLFIGSSKRQVQHLTYEILVLNFIVTLIITRYQLKGKKKEIDRNKEIFKKNAIYRISSLLNTEIINRVPRISQLGRSIELFGKLNNQDIDENHRSWYTNEEFAEKSSELLDSLNLLESEIIKGLELIDSGWNINPYSTRWRNNKFRNHNSPISQSYAILRGQSGENKAKEILESLGILYYEGFNLKDDSIDESVEIDFLTVLDGVVYVIEVKNYSADRIILKSSGQFIREKNNMTYKLDTLSQIRRHNQFLRKIYGSLDIVNYIVLTDKDTLVDDEFKNDNVQVLYVDGLEFKLKKIQSESDRNLLDKISVNEGEAKKFPFFNIDNALSEVNGILYEINNDTKIKAEELLTTEQTRKLNSEIKEIILEELNKIDGYNKNKDLTKEIIDELSLETMSKYKALLG